MSYLIMKTLDMSYLHTAAVTPEKKAAVMY